MKSVTEVTKTVQNNRRNGKKYEGELVRTLRDSGISARLGRSNEEGDVILPDHGIIIEAKSTCLKDRYRMSKAPDQFLRLMHLSQNVWYAVRYKGKGLAGWRFYPIPEKIQVLRKEEGYTLKEFLFILEQKKGHEGIHQENHVKIHDHEQTSEPILIKMPKRGIGR